VERTNNALTIGGSIFGSGNLTRVGGRRTITVKGLSGELDSLQRAHTVTIENCDLVLTGAEDKVDGTSLNFSLARVPEEVRLIHSDLSARTEFNEVKAFGSYLPDGTEDTSGNNTLTVLAGRVLNFGATDVNTNEFVYGKVSGVTTLRWEEDTSLPDSLNQGVFIHANLDSDIGTPVETGLQTDTGAFVAAADQSMSPEKSLRTGEEGNYRFWHLGGASVVVQVVLQLTKNEDTKTVIGGKTYYQDEAEFRLPTVVPSLTEFSAATPDLSKFTALLSRDGDQILTLNVKKDGLWGGQDFMVYVVDGETGPEIVHQDEIRRPLTQQAGRPKFSATFFYTAAEKIATGTVAVQLRAHGQGEDVESASRGTFTLRLVIQSVGEGTAESVAKAGRQYGLFSADSAQSPVIACDGAVTAQVKLNYTPQVLKDENGVVLDKYGEIPVLTLRKKNAPDQTVDVSPHVLMVDLFTPNAPRWYVGKMTNGAVKLSELENVRGMERWKAPLAGETVSDKSLLFILDFRDADDHLSAGDYNIFLEFPERHSCASSGAAFQVKDLTGKGTLA